VDTSRRVLESVPMFCCITGQIMAKEDRLMIDKLSARLVLVLGSIWLGEASAMETSEPFTIADPESGAASVVIAPTASEITRKYSQVLAQIIEQMCGSLPAITTDVPAAERAIVVGTTAEFPDSPRVDELKGENPEAFVLHSTADRLYIIGNSDVGTQQGIFTLLRHLGCRWFFPHEAWTIIPERDTLQIDISTIDSPDYDCRYIWYAYGAHTEKLGSDFQAWYRHNRQRGWFNTACGHAYAKFVPRSLSEEHPEYFALVDGKRGGNQICTTDPDFLQLAIDYALNSFERSIDNPEAIMVSVEPNDGGGFYEGDRCLAVGSISDRVFLLRQSGGAGSDPEVPRQVRRTAGVRPTRGAAVFQITPERVRATDDEYAQDGNDLRGADRRLLRKGQQLRHLRLLLHLSVGLGGLPGKARAGDLDYLRTVNPYYHILGANTFVPESKHQLGRQRSGILPRGPVVLGHGVRRRCHHRGLLRQGVRGSRRAGSAILRTLAGAQRPTRVK